jgi:hypothetical protein
MNTKTATLLILTLTLFYFQAWSQKATAPFLKLTNKEGMVITQKDSVVSKKFFESPIVNVESDEPIPRGSEIMLMLGEMAFMFDNPMLSPGIKQQILKTKANTKVVFSIQQKTNKELKFRLVD